MCRDLYKGILAYRTCFLLLWLLDHSSFTIISFLRRLLWATTLGKVAWAETELCELQQDSLAGSQRRETSLTKPGGGYWAGILKPARELMRESGAGVRVGVEIRWRGCSGTLLDSEGITGSRDKQCAIIWVQPTTTYIFIHTSSCSEQYFGLQDFVDNFYTWKKNKKNTWSELHTYI